MSKNTDFFKLGPYSRKNSIRTGIETKIGQTENIRAKLAVPRALMRQQRTGSAWSRAQEGASRRLHARPLPRSRGRLFRFARLALRFGPACRRHVSTPRWSYVAPDDGRRVSGACRCPSPLTGRSLFFFFLSLFFLLCTLKIETQSSFPIFISFNP